MAALKTQQILSRIADVTVINQRPKGREDLFARWLQFRGCFHPQLTN